MLMRITISILPTPLSDTWPNCLSKRYVIAHSGIRQEKYYWNSSTNKNVRLFNVREMRCAEQVLCR